MRMRPGHLLRQWMDRRAVSGARVALAYRNIFILPTRTGLLFAAVVIAIWLGAVNYNSNMAFLLCFLLAGFALTSMVHTFRNLLGLRFTAANAEPVFAGDTAAFPVHVDNPSARVRTGVAIGPSASDSAIVNPSAASWTTSTITLPAGPRGILPLPVLVVATTFPGGLFRAWARIRLEAECLVRPAPEPRPVPEPPGAPSPSSGSSSRPGEDDFGGLRPYQPGDPLRRVAWHTLARGDGLQTKQFTGETPDRIWLDDESLLDLPLERRLARLCRWILDAENAGHAYGLSLRGHTIAPGNGPGHAARCLDALARFPQ